MTTRTDAAIDRMTEWEATASGRDIQIQMLRVAIETRDKVDAIRGIVTFFAVLWVMAAVLAGIAMIDPPS